MLQNNGEGVITREAAHPCLSCSRYGLATELAVGRGRKHLKARFAKLLVLPPEPAGAARWYNVNVTRRLAALAPRVPHVCLPCEYLRVAGESGDGVWASYLRLDPLASTSTDNAPV